MISCLDGPGSGDVILYSSDHPLHKRLERVTGCRWSQVSLCLRTPGEPELLVFEATRLSECPDLRTGTVIRGVQIVRAPDRFLSFPGIVACRRLVPPLASAQRAALLGYADEVHERPFNDNKWAAARAFRRTNPAPDGSSFFCSHLVAEAYQRIGLLPPPPAGLSANNYIAADFSSESPRARLPLTEGFRLEVERVLADGRGPS